MFHIAAFTASAIGSANQDIAALSDDILFIQNGHFVLQQDMQVIWAASMSVNITRSRLNSPSIRQYAPKYIRPIIAAVIPGSNPNVDFEYMAPFVLRGQEEIANEFTQTNAMAERQTTIIGLADRITPAPSGPQIPLRVTSTTAAVANSWTTLALTYETALPPGRYAVVNAEMQSTNGQAFRLLFDVQQYRPGYLMSPALTSRNAFESYEGVFGLWGTFTTISLPRAQVLANAADAAFEGYIYCVKIG